MTQGVVMLGAGQTCAVASRDFAPPCTDAPVGARRQLLDLTPNFGRNPSYPAHILKTERCAMRKLGHAVQRPDRL